MNDYKLPFKKVYVYPVKRLRIRRELENTIDIDVANIHALQEKYRKGSRKQFNADNIKEIIDATSYENIKEIYKNFHYAKDGMIGRRNITKVWSLANKILKETYPLVDSSKEKEIINNIWMQLLLYSTVYEDNVDEITRLWYWLHLELKYLQKKIRWFLFQIFVCIFASYKNTFSTSCNFKNQ